MHDGETGLLFQPHEPAQFSVSHFTDEDMFNALRVSLPAAVTVWVAHDSPASATVAEFSVADTDALRDLLSEIARRRGGESFAKTG